MWVKLHDSWLEWEWHTDPNMVSLFFHLLSMASKKDTRWRGHEIMRGQCVVGRKMLSEKTGISERTIRTCLDRLEQTGEILRKVTNKLTIVTICNFEKYQQNPQSTDQQLTNNRPTTDQQLTTLLDNKNIEDNCVVVSARARLEESTICNSLWLNQTSMALHYADVMGLAVDVMTEWELTEVPDDEWTAGHLFNHMRKKLDIRKKENKPTKAEEKAAWRAKMIQSIQNDLTHGNTPK